VGTSRLVTNAPADRQHGSNDDAHEHLTNSMDTPELLGDVEVRFMAGYESTKDYVCPGCNRAIPARTGHYVVVPTEAPDLRRHWHRGCWIARSRRMR